VERFNTHKKELQYKEIIRLYTLNNYSLCKSVESKLKLHFKHINILIKKDTQTEIFKTTYEHDIIYVLTYFEKYINEIIQNESTVCESFELEKYKLDVQSKLELEKFKIEKQLDFELEKYKLDKRYNQTSIINNIEEEIITNATKQIDNNVASIININKSVPETSGDTGEKPTEITGDISLNDSNNVNTNKGGIKKDLAKVTKSKIIKCSCGSFKSINSNTCKQCDRIAVYEKLIEYPKYVSTRPTAEQLKKDIDEKIPYIWIGKKYGCSDNNIRKWVKRFEKNKPI